MKASFLIGGLAALCACKSESNKSKGGEHEEGGRKTKKGEAEVQLDAIRKGAMSYFTENAAFPSGSAGPTPEISCCEQGRPDRKCAVDVAQWAGVEVWDQLAFEMSEPHFFQYVYESENDGAGFVAKAVGDLDCDGTSIEYVLVGEAVGGQPKFDLTKPPRAD